MAMCHNPLSSSSSSSSSSSWCQVVLTILIIFFLNPMLSVSLSTLSISEEASSNNNNNNNTIICALIPSNNSQSPFLNCTSFPTTTTSSSSSNINAQLPNISVSAIAGGIGFQCILRSLNTTTSTLSCLRFSAAAAAYKRIYIGPMLDQLDAGNSHICGRVSVTNRIQCWQWREFNGSSINQNNLTGIAVGGEFICGLSQVGSTIQCFGDVAIDRDRPNGSFSVVAAGLRHACAISSVDGRIHCWGQPAAAAAAAAAGGVFRSLALGDNRSCALRDNNETVVCWGENDFRLPESLAGTKFLSIKAKGRIFCGVVTSNYSLVCFGSDSNSMMVVFQRVLPGPCQMSCPCQIIPDSGTLCNNNGVICQSCQSPPPPPPPSGSAPPALAPSSGNDIDTARIAFLVVGCVGTCALVSVICFFLLRYCKQRRGVSRVHDSGPLDDQDIEPAHHSSSSSTPRPPISLEKRLSKLVSLGQGGQLEEFPLQVLLQATENFSQDHKIGYGSFGTVYRAKLNDGREVAIKRAELTSSSVYGVVTKRQDDKENAFLSELAHLSRVNHKNLVRLYGFCEDSHELVLVYEFMSNGTLHEHLHKLEISPLRSWTARLKVALDAARGIEYLHTYVVPSVIHRDIKSSNILLDSTWTAKVSDFGLSLMGPEDEESHLSLRAAGTVGYMDPEYYRLQQLTTKSDVYSFGVVMLELLSGYKAIHLQENGSPRNVVDYIVPYIIADEMHSVLDPQMAPPTPYEIEAVTYVGYLAADCVSLEGRDRPSMTEVVTSLERALGACGTQPTLLSRSATS